MVPFSVHPDPPTNSFIKALIDALELLLEYTVQPDCSTASTELEWGEEWKNLVPNPLTLFGPPKDGWMEDGLASLKELDGVVAAAKVVLLCYLCQGGN